MDKLPIHEDDFCSGRICQRRYDLTLAFIRKHLPLGSVIFDLGTVNGLGIFLSNHGYRIFNTHGEDFDLEPPYQFIDADVTTAFEILEHLMDPFNLLRRINTKKLFISVPLRIWFAGASRSNDNPAGWHFHEFEQWQLDWMLDKTGWKIIDREIHTNPTYGLGIRSLLRFITPRMYLIYAERK